MRVRKICRDYGIIQPQFSEISNGFMATLYKEERQSQNANIIKEFAEYGNVPVNVPVNTPDVLNTLEMNILDEIRQNNTIVLSDIAVKLGVNIKTIKRYVLKLKQKGLLQRIGPDKGGYWKVNDIKT
jgi:ATP-dependent DNA helicase RecG